MERIYRILKELKPEVEICEDTKLIEECVVDSISILMLVNALIEEFEVEISVKDITPVNFATPKAIQKLIMSLEEEDA